MPDNISGGGTGLAIQGSSIVLANAPEPIPIEQPGAIEWDYTGGRLVARWGTNPLGLARVRWTVTRDGSEIFDQRWEHQGAAAIAINDIGPAPLPGDLHLVEVQAADLREESLLWSAPTSSVYTVPFTGREAPQPPAPPVMPAGFFSPPGTAEPDEVTLFDILVPVYGVGRRLLPRPAPAAGGGAPTTEGGTPATEGSPWDFVWATTPATIVPWILHKLGAGDVLKRAIGAWSALFAALELLIWALVPILVIAAIVLVWSWVRALSPA